MTFFSRAEAGRALGVHLADRGLQPDVVLGLPRGGVVVGAEVARVLDCPLDVLVVRKLGHPQYPEFAVGALAEPDVVILDEPAMARSRVDRPELNRVIELETERLHNYRMKFHRPDGLELSGRAVLIVDDGLATGATAVAAVLSARKQSARSVIVAAPVASPQAVERLAPVADGVIALLVEPEFEAVGHYYEQFPQLEDDEVMALLHLPA